MNVSLEQLDRLRRLGFRPQVVLIFIHGRKVFFFYRKDHRLWQFPQGGIDNGELPREAILREIEEEIGENFSKGIKEKNVYFLDDSLITFPRRLWGSKDLVTDDGEKIILKGKRYFIYVITTNIEKMKLDDSEFDDSQLLSYDDALRLARSVYQKNKREIILGILRKLKNVDLID